jgi:hypothetical protein
MSIMENGKPHQIGHHIPDSATAVTNFDLIKSFLEIEFCLKTMKKNWRDFIVSPRLGRKPNQVKAHRASSDV